MKTYVILLRGINVGGKNRVPMAELRTCLEELGLEGVRTYIASGNAIARSRRGAKAVRDMIEAELPQRFTLNTDLLRVHVITAGELRAVVEGRPSGFGDEPDRYHSDVIFLLGISASAAMEVFDPRDGVDRVWPGEGVIYSQRLSAERTKSRLGKIVGTKPYQSMTIRNWNTVSRLLDLIAEG